MAEEVFRILSWSVPGRTARHEARSAGTTPQPGGRPVTADDLDWADVVCVMEEAHRDFVRTRFVQHAGKVRVLGIPDDYMPGDPVLRDLLTTHVLSLLAESPPSPAPAGRRT